MYKNNILWHVENDDDISFVLQYYLKFKKILQKYKYTTVQIVDDCNVDEKFKNILKIPKNFDDLENAIFVGNFIVTFDTDIINIPIFNMFNIFVLKPCKIPNVHLVSEDQDDLEHILWQYVPKFYEETYKINTHDDGIKAFINENNITCKTININDVDVLCMGLLPRSGYTYDGGYNLSTNEDVCLKQGEIKTITLDQQIYIPPNYMGLLMARSSTMKFGIMNVGLIDAQYTGPLSIIFMAFKDVFIPKGSNIVQIVIVPTTNVNFLPVKILPNVGRGTLGFGSTNKIDDIKPILM